jgi:hypothetical protein
MSGVVTVIIGSRRKVIKAGARKLLIVVTMTAADALKISVLVEDLFTPQTVSVSSVTAVTLKYE